MLSLKGDEEAEQFVESADLSEYDLSGFAPVKFEFEPKTAVLNMRLPQNLLAAVKIWAKAEGMPYTLHSPCFGTSDYAALVGPLWRGPYLPSCNQKHGGLNW
ncbi:MAG: BrnA antitoxin family protein [Zoogloeaceae bacterium]|nr:BrnA antitoxin family protein [Zoogloeaceae bacterium]